MEHLAIAHFDYDQCIEHPDYLASSCLNGCSFPDLLRLCDSNCTRYRYFARFSVRTSESWEKNQKRRMDDESMDAGLLWQGFLPRLMNIPGISSRQRFFWIHVTQY